MKYADLHLHTTFSDGTFTPERLVKEAFARGLCCIAITDHDEVKGCDQAIEVARGIGMEIVPGVELTAEEDNYEIHVLGYFIDYKQDWFKEKLKILAEVRRERALAMLEKLAELGLKLDTQELLQQASPGTVGRLHIARMLEAKGLVSSIPEAFYKYIGNDKPCYVKKLKLTPKQAIEMIIKLNGVAVLAHPHILNNDQLIGEFAKLGLGGIEAYYPEYTPQRTQHYSELAQKHGLLITGGSDCHGLGKEEISMGKIKLPYQFVELLKQKSQALKNG